MHYNVRGDVTDDLVRRFKAMNPPAILVTPSVSTGYDFPGKDCECQIIDKVPFPPRQKMVVVAREALDSEYSIYHAIQDLVQAAGRPTRSASDKAETFIIDNNIEWVMNRYRYLVPKWFYQAYSVEPVIPKPLVL
jgi:Rad3-related DNA helicase